MVCGSRWGKVAHRGGWGEDAGSGAALRRRARAILDCTCAEDGGFILMSVAPEHEDGMACDVGFECNRSALPLFEHFNVGDVAKLVKRAAGPGERVLGAIVTDTPEWSVLVVAWTEASGVGRPPGDARAHMNWGRSHRRRRRRPRTQAGTPPDRRTALQYVDKGRYGSGTHTCSTLPRRLERARDEVQKPGGARGLRASTGLKSLRPSRAASRFHRGLAAVPALQDAPLSSRPARELGQHIVTFSCDRRRTPE